MKIPEEIRKNLFRVYKTIKLKENIFGTSPPSIFVSSASYPITNIGLLTNYQEDERSYILDYPEYWYRERLDEIEILKLRTNLVYSFTKGNLNSSNKFSEKLREIVISKKPVDVEIKIKKPYFSLKFFKFSRPIGNPTKIEDFKIVDNISAEKIVEEIINENISAKDAVLELYNKVEISTIEKLFTAGLLGKIKNRKFVPTRWSITAVDSIISENLINEIREFEIIERPMLFYNEYLKNRYWIFLIPFYFMFEVFEILKDKVYYDFEGIFGRKEYAENVAGGYYAIRLGICEILKKMQKQAAVVVYRKVDEFSFSLGVWKVREAVRDAKLIKTFEKFEELRNFIKDLDERVLKNSFVLKNIKKQYTLNSLSKLWKK
jgi:hypothetical protein